MNKESEMGEVKRYDSYGYDGMSGLMKEHAEGDWVSSDDYDALLSELHDVLDVKKGCGPTALSAAIADRDALRAENAELQRVRVFEERRREHYLKWWRESVDEPFTEWLNDDATHWICDEDAAFQAWQYLHENKIYVMKEQTEIATKERDKLLAENAELVAALDLSRGFLINKGYSASDPLVIGAIDAALAKHKATQPSDKP